jgi:hypothetical protein
MMGSEIEASRPLEISAEAVPTAPVTSFDLIRNNRVIHRVTASRMSYTYAGEMSRGDYFYVRLTQDNDQFAFSSPVWIK